MKVWDYKIKKGWKPKDDEWWIWYLERKINYGDMRGLNPQTLKKYLRRLHIDQGKRMALNSYFKYYGIK